MPLGPPPPTAVTPEAYFDLSSGPIGPLGRPQRVKSKSRTFKGKMWMSDEYPIALKDILPVLQTLERSSVVFSKLTETLSLDLPPGFPVQFGTFLCLFMLFLLISDDFFRGTCAAHLERTCDVPQV